MQHSQLIITYHCRDYSFVHDCVPFGVVARFVPLVGDYSYLEIGWGNFAVTTDWRILQGKLCFAGVFKFFYFDFFFTEDV